MAAFYHKLQQVAVDLELRLLSPGVAGESLYFTGRLNPFTDFMVPRPPKHFLPLRWLCFQK